MQEEPIYVFIVAMTMFDWFRVVFMIVVGVLGVTVARGGVGVGMGVFGFFVRM